MPSKFLYNLFLNKLIDTLLEGGFILGCWLLFQIINYGIKNLEDHLQAKMSSIQQTDNTYDSVNFDDPISTISYFAKLCQPYTRRSEEELNQRFKGMMTQIIKTKDGSTKSAEVQVQHIMRSAAEKIHVAFREFNRDSIAITAKLVTLVIEEACKSLLDLMDDRVDVDYSSPYWKLLSG